MLALSVVLMILMIMDVAFLLREKRKESLYGTPNAAISDEIYDSAHLFENSCRFAWVEDEEPSLKVCQLFPLRGMPGSCKGVIQ
ncbi:unnamed protein product [Heligmosomoides polygyrus]|uniref:Secreted protein n=1 Tax=Heligmosomoides polygyrus TaxID=6339 RepID=A0A183F8U7_HELPZ|nr:unnamed protein product [Heligmosomoides polygyrus]